MMGARICGIRLQHGFTTVTSMVLTVLALIGGSHASQAAAGPANWAGEPSQSVLVDDVDSISSSIPEQHGGHGVVAAQDDGLLDLVSSGVASFSSTSCTTSDYGCTCTDCQQGNHCHDAGCCLVDCDPPGLLQRLAALHDKSGMCWTGRVDALLLWRNAPPGRPLVDSGLAAGVPVLNANQMDSTPAAGPRVSLFRTNTCTGDAWEATWLRAANFRSQRPLPLTNQQYVLASPGIYGNTNFQPFDTGFANLGSRVQSFELNHHRCHGKNLRWLAGFRWVEWQEQFTLQDTATGFTPVITDLYQTGCINSMYGGQIGANVFLLSLPWLRVDSVVKAGAYYNNATQSSLYTTTDPAFPGTATVTVGRSPASCAFVGEVGMTGVLPINSCLDFRFGYFGLWLSGIAQPTQQLSGQQLTPGVVNTGTLNTNGGVLVQGLTLGLEGRW